MEQTSLQSLGLLYERYLPSEFGTLVSIGSFRGASAPLVPRHPRFAASFVVLESYGQLSLEKQNKQNDNNYLFLRRFFFGGRFEAGSPPAPSRRRTLFVARVGAAAMGSSGHGCFGYRPRCSARTAG